MEYGITNDYTFMKSPVSTVETHKMASARGSIPPTKSTDLLFSSSDAHT
jgi:hypothetical protein